jgi:4-hydroxy-tetrahydrodipicolinate synthase
MALSGVLPVFQTPYLPDERVDYATLERELHWLFDCGADGVVFAMVSELLRLSTDERRDLAQFICKIARPRGTAVISVGAESAKVAESLAQHAEASGATAVMAIPPVSIAVLEPALDDYYRRILAATALPVIIQDASGYVGRPMSIEFQARLFDNHGPDRVLFKPEATPIGPRLTALHEATAHRATIFEGTGGLALVDSYQRGIAGTMPGADLIKPIVALWRALHASDEQRITQISAPLCALVSLQTSLDAFLAVEKHLLVRQGIFSNTIVRGPAGYVLSDDTRRQVDRLFDQLMEVTAAT